MKYEIMLNAILQTAAKDYENNSSFFILHSSFFISIKVYLKHIFACAVSKKISTFAF
jgi:hypothetical protein